MTLKEYYELLESHDWYYGMSDDYSIYINGETSSLRLLSLAKESPAFAELYHKFFNWKFKKGSKPELPKV